jgi:hypothetical protein
MRFSAVVLAKLEFCKYLYCKSLYMERASVFWRQFAIYTYNRKHKPCPLMKNLPYHAGLLPRAAGSQKGAHRMTVPGERR